MNSHADIFNNFYITVSREIYIAIQEARENINEVYSSSGTPTFHISPE